jgi:hypothetical protein
MYGEMHVFFGTYSQAKSAAHEVWGDTDVNMVAVMS